MSTNFQIQALSKSSFQHLLGLSDKQLAQYQAQWITADAHPGYPCRVSMVDVQIGERVLLLPFKYHDVESPYNASGPIFISEHATTAKLGINEIPQSLSIRLLSVRGYNKQNMMIEAEVTEGELLRQAIERQFSNSAIEYIQVHNANPGCYSCTVHRV